MDAIQACGTYKQARDAEISVWAGTHKSHATVRGGCASAGWLSQAAKRSSGFPEGNT